MKTAQDSKCLLACTTRKRSQSTSGWISAPLDRERSGAATAAAAVDWGAAGGHRRRRVGGQGVSTCGGGEIFEAGVRFSYDFLFFGGWGDFGGFNFEPSDG